MAIKLDGKLKKYVNVSEEDRANFFLIKRTENFKLDRDTILEVISDRMFKFKDISKYPNFAGLRPADYTYIAVILRSNYARLCRDHEKYDINVESFVKIFEQLFKENKEEYEVQAQEYEEKAFRGELTPNGAKYENKATKICTEICARALTLCSSIKLENINLKNQVSTIDKD